MDMARAKIDRPFFGVIDIKSCNCLAKELARRKKWTMSVGVPLVRHVTLAGMLAVSCPSVYSLAVCLFVTQGVSTGPFTVWQRFCESARLRINGLVD